VTTKFEKSSDKSLMERPATQAQADTKQKRARGAASAAKKAMREFGADSKEASAAVDKYQKADADATATQRRVRKPAPKRKIAGEVQPAPAKKTAKPKPKRNIAKMTPVEVAAYVVDEVAKNGPFGTRRKRLGEMTFPEAIAAQKACEDEGCPERDITHSHVEHEISQETEDEAFAHDQAIADERDPREPDAEAASATLPPVLKPVATRAQLRAMSDEDRRRQAEAARLRPLVRPMIPIRGARGADRGYNRLVATCNATAVIQQGRRDYGDQLRALKGN